MRACAGSAKPPPKRRKSGCAAGSRRCRLQASTSPTDVGSGPSGRRPNIVVILADDLGNADLGYRGSDIKTPNIDALAKGGVRLESFYGMPASTPARAALMTGRYPMRYGLQTMVISPSQTYGLPTEERTLAQALKEAGYRTAMVGKWHLGHADQKYWPQNRGFDHFYGNLVGEVDHLTKEIGGLDRLAAQRPVPQGERLFDHADRQRGRAYHRRRRRQQAALSVCGVLWRRMRPSRRRPTTSTATSPLPTKSAAPTRPWSRRWTIRSAASSPRSTRRACATTP